MTVEEFPRRLVEAVPAAATTVVEEHLRDQFGVLLMHLLVADLRRFAVGTYERGDEQLTRELLEFVDLAFRVGDPDVENAIAVSFVEDIGWWEPEVQPFIASWPDALRAEVERQSSSD